jgi:hypothetical protein
MEPGNWSGLYFGDRSRGKFIGRTSATGEFNFRVARGLFSNYSGYTWLRGSVKPEDVRSVVLIRFAPHAMMQFGTAVALFLFALLGVALVLASLRQSAFLGFLPVLLIIPVVLYFVQRSVHRDRRLLREHLEAELRRYGPLQVESPD